MHVEGGENIRKMRVFESIWSRYKNYVYLNQASTFRRKSNYFTSSFFESSALSLSLALKRQYDIVSVYLQKKKKKQSFPLTFNDRLSLKKGNIES